MTVYLIDLVADVLPCESLSDLIGFNLAKHLVLPLKSHNYKVKVSVI
jgi:hypothetical protein